MCLNQHALIERQTSNWIWKFVFAPRSSSIQVCFAHLFNPLFGPVRSQCWEWATNSIWHAILSAPSPGPPLPGKTEKKNEAKLTNKEIVTANVLMHDNGPRYKNGEKWAERQFKSEHVNKLGFIVYISHNNVRNERQQRRTQCAWNGKCSPRFPPRIHWCWPVFAINEIDSHSIGCGCSFGRTSWCVSVTIIDKYLAMFSSRPFRHSSPFVLAFRFRFRFLLHSNQWIDRNRRNPNPTYLVRSNNVIIIGEINSQTPTHTHVHTQQVAPIVRLALAHARQARADAWRVRVCFTLMLHAKWTEREYETEMRAINHFSGDIFIVIRYYVQ